MANTAGIVADGVRADGSWELQVQVDDVPLRELGSTDASTSVHKKIRVRGDQQIGSVMSKITESVSDIVQKDWSCYRLWWPEKKLWLKKTRSTLDQCGVLSTSKLEFTPAFKSIYVQLPDLQQRELTVDFSMDVFEVVIDLCKRFKIRHPEELSLSRKLDKEELRRNQGISATRRQALGNHSLNGQYMSHTSLDNLASPKFNGVGSPNTPQGTLRPPPSPYPFSTITSHNNSSLLNGSLHSLSFELDEKSFTNSPQELDVQATLRGLNRPKNLSEKARINAGWLDSSRSLMEQDIDRGSLLLLRFKYASYYDLNPKYDAVRVNQLFEQARWSLLTETIDCTEEDMVLFAALNHHIYSKARRGETDFVDGENNVDNVDSMLDELESALAGTQGLNTSIVIEHVPELCGQLQYVTNKPKKSLLPDLSKKKKQTSFFHLKEKTLNAYKKREDKDVTNPSWSVDLDECEVREEVNLSTRLFVIRLYTSLSSDGFSELCLHCDSQEQFKDWVTACKLASRGKTMADCSYQLEKDALQKKLDMLTFETSSPTERLTSAEMYVSPKYIKKHKSGIISKISAVCSNSKLNKMSINEAKMQYLKLWQDLPEQPLTYFIVRFDGSKKEELLAIAADKIVRLDLINGSVIQKWPFKNMNRWHVNWQTKQVCIEFREKMRENTIKFYCLTADCKTVHEFIGGYIFVGMRSADKSQTLDKNKFYKLTAGRE